MARFLRAAANDEVLEPEEPGLGLRFEPGTADCRSDGGRFGTLRFSWGPMIGGGGAMVGPGIDDGGRGFEDKTETQGII